jgi:hypothetical protein
MEEWFIHNNEMENERELVVGIREEK